MGLFSKAPFDDDYHFGPTDAGSFARRERLKHAGRTINIDTTGSITSFTKRNDMYIAAQNVEITASKGAPTVLSFTNGIGMEIKVTLSSDAAGKVANALLPHASFDAIHRELKSARNTTIFYMTARPGDVLDRHNKLVIQQYGAPLAKIRVLQEGNRYGARRIVEFLDSSAIKRAAYSVHTKELIIEFTGTLGPKSKRIYRYLEVPPDYAKGLEQAESAGRYYNDVIKGAYPGHGIDVFPTV